ncbi:PulJ/GspJ family protein [Deinococcus ruber]|uniref:PulJ/GspJ family protein n=1 Tax=Deinococcus ruber TaxID=1848197 RepID=UPI00166E9C99
MGRSSSQGFTLIELLIASAVALLILLVLGQTTNLSMRISARENQNLPVQQQLRASIEAMSQEIRDSIGPRIFYSNINGPGVTLPSELVASSGSSITLFVPVPNSTFVVSPPVGYPVVTTLASRTSTITQDPSLTDTSSTSVSCSTAFSGNEYAVLYSTQKTDFLNGAARNADSFRILKVAPTSPCLSTGSIGTVGINHINTPLPALSWNPNTYIVEVTPITYSVTDNTLYRQIIGQTAQVVAYNISSLTLSYLPDNPSASIPNCTSATYFATPGCAPRSINVTLTSTPQNTLVTGAKSITASQIVFLR